MNFFSSKTKEIESRVVLGLACQSTRKEQDEESQMRQIENQKAYQHKTRTVPVDSIEDVADENENFIEENRNDSDFVA